MDLDLKDKVVIVTGGGRGMGKATSLTFAEEGARIVIGELRELWGQEVVDEIKSKRGTAVAVASDLTNPDNAQLLAKTAIDTFGQIDILVNNLGVSRSNYFMKMSRDDWDFEIKHCFYTFLDCTKAVLPNMIERQTGCIVNVASDAGRVGEPNQPVYSGTKGAMIAFTKALAKDVARYHIRVNVVCPAFTLIERFADIKALESHPDPTKVEQGRRFQEQMDKMLKLYPLRKFGTPQDIANMTVFLASDRAGHVTGQTVSVDGGYSMV